MRGVAKFSISSGKIRYGALPVSRVSGGAVVDRIEAGENQEWTV